MNLESFKAGDIETALRESFHKMDELIEDEVTKFWSKRLHLANF